MNRYSKLSLLAAAIAAAGTVAYAAQRGMENDAMTITSAKIPLVQAISAAELHVNGKATRAEYENSKQGWVYDVEVVSVYRRRENARFAVDPAVPVRALSDQVPPDGDTLAHPYGRCGGVEEAMRRVPSVLVPPSERRYRKLSAHLQERTDDWAAGMANGSFATMLCPAWMLEIGVSCWLIVHR